MKKNYVILCKSYFRKKKYCYEKSQIVVNLITILKAYFDVLCLNSQVYQKVSAEKSKRKKAINCTLSLNRQVFRFTQSLKEPKVLKYKVHLIFDFNHNSQYT